MFKFFCENGFFKYYVVQKLHNKANSTFKIKFRYLNIVEIF